MKVVAEEVTNTSHGHKKFYRVFVCADGTEVRNWGRIGTVGQFKTIPHQSKYEASSSAATKIDEEIMKGYRNREVREFETDLVNQESLRQGWFRGRNTHTPPSPAPEHRQREDSYQQILWETA